MNGTKLNSSATLELSQNDSNSNNSSDLALMFPPPEYVDIFTFVVSRILLPMTCIGGIVGTFLTVLVLNRKSMCTPMNSYLKALAITDLILLSLLSTHLLEPYFLKTLHYHIFHIYLEFITIFCSWFNLVSIWLTVMLSIERYIAICHPFRVAALNGAVGARTSILIIYITAFILGLPKFWEIKVMDFPETGPYITAGDLVANKQFIQGYRIFYEGILSMALPFLFLLTINSRLIQGIRKSTYYSRHFCAADSALGHMISAEQLQLTLMLMGITVAFFLFHAPYLVYTVIDALYQNKLTTQQDRDMLIAFNITRQITKLLIGIKSAIDFILYCWISEKFRVTFKKLFCMPNCLTQPQLRRLSMNNTHRNSYHMSKETTC